MSLDEQMTPVDHLAAGITVPEALLNIDNMPEEQVGQALEREHFLWRDASDDMKTVRRLVWEWQVGPVAPFVPVECGCSEPLCVSPWHLKLGEPTGGRDPGKVFVHPEARCYFLALERISATRRYPHDAHLFAGYATGLMLLARAYLYAEDREAIQELLSIVEENELWSGITVDEAETLGAAIRVAENLPWPVNVNAPSARPARLVALAPDVAALLPKEP